MSRLKWDRPAFDKRMRGPTEPADPRGGKTADVYPGSERRAKGPRPSKVRQTMLPCGCTVPGKCDTSEDFQRLIAEHECERKET